MSAAESAADDEELPGQAHELPAENAGLEAPDDAEGSSHGGNEGPYFQFAGKLDHGFKGGRCSSAAPSEPSRLPPRLTPRATQKVNNRLSIRRSEFTTVHPFSK